MSLIPAPLKSVLVDQPAEFPQLIANLVATTEEDERILASASELRDAIGSRLTTSGDTLVRSAAAVQLSDGASMLPSQPNLSANPICSVLRRDASSSSELVAWCGSTREKSWCWSLASSRLSN